MFLYKPLSVISAANSAFMAPLMIASVSNHKLYCCKGTSGDYTSKWIHSFAESVADGSPSTLDANSRWTETTRQTTFRVARQPSMCGFEPAASMPM
jgi:hypothetical protein